MSLSSVLLKRGGASVDSGLDSIFNLNTTKAPPRLPQAAGSSIAKEKKRKVKETEVQDNTSKKPRLSGAGKDETGVPVTSPTAGLNVKKSRKTTAQSYEQQHETTLSTTATPRLEISQKRAEKKKTPRKDVRKDSTESRGGEDEEAKARENELDEQDDTKQEDEEEGEEGEGEENQDEGEALPVHESLLKGRVGETPSKKRKRNDGVDEETDARTVFVGNVAVHVLKPKELKKQLIQHLTSFVPHCEVESIRFRSVPFKTPTSNLADQTMVEKVVGSFGWGRISNRGREEKVAFIKGEFHESIDTANAYAIFAPLKADKADDSPLTGAEVASLIVERANGSTFLGKTLRVDRIGKQASGWGSSDPKLTVFVGNLDFAAKEEAIRTFFEELVKSERGEPAKSWVATVRVVRDKTTQLGKGFAYVSFVDRECVDYVLAADADQLKMAKRTLRVQRCKTAPTNKTAPSSDKLRTLPEKAGAGRSVKPRPAPVDVPKGDPKLGERLAGLDKDARRAVKAADADRVARRLAKKKARAAMVKGKGAVNLERGARERKRVDKHGKGSATKPRMKSARAIAKRNQKK